jgi:hypothetical protein
MADVLSLPVSTSLLNEVNAVGDPKRNKAQDGTIGDKAHEERVSDHNRDETGNTGSSSDADKINEVHARDVDSRGPWLIKGGAERIVQLIIANVRAMGYTKRRVKYVISNRRIWVWRKVNGSWQFIQEAYSGSDPHVLHFHVSFEYGSGSGASNPENNTSPWGILAAYKAEEDLPVDQATYNKLFLGALKDPTIRTEVGKAMLEATGWSEGYPGRKLSQHFNDTQVERNFRAGHPDAKGQQIDPASPLGQMAKAAEIIVTSQPGTVHTQ